MFALYRKVLAALVLGAVAAPALACDYPRPPDIPSGETATRDQMGEAQREVRAFLAAAEAYLACLSERQKEPGYPVSERQAEIDVMRHNAMVEEMHRVADDYNVAVRIFKARE